MAQRYAIGDEIGFYCKRCRLNLNGNVAVVEDGVAIKVTCRTCHYTQPNVPEKSDDDLRDALLRKAFRIRDKRRQQFVQPEEVRAAPSGGTDVTARWREAAEDVDARYAPRYDRHGDYELGATLIHREHGLGIVQQVLHENAVLVLFRKVECPLEMNVVREDY
jgi:hypothetical protein